MLNEPNQIRNDLRNLLGYAEELLKADERIVADLDDDAIAVFYEHNIAGLEGVSVPTDETEDFWLRVDRLRETPPPQPESVYLPWLAKSRSGANPFEPPRLDSKLMVKVSIEEASELEEAGLALADDVMPPKGERAEDANRVDVILRMANMAEFAAGFAAWIAGPWADWEAAERPRRASIAFYNGLFEIQQRAIAMGEDLSVETVMGVGLARWEHRLGRINAPLVEAAVELELAPDDGAIVVRPRPQPPRLALRNFHELGIPAVGQLEKDAADQLRRNWEDADVGFSPHERAGFEPVLRMCHARLASDAVYEPDARGPDDRSLPPIDAKLQVTDTWVIYVRPRSTNFRCEDIRRLSEAVEHADEHELPAPAIHLTRKPSDKLVDGERIDLSDTRLRAPGLGAPAPRSGPQGAATASASPAPCKDNRPDEAFFFPLPYNDEQIEIARLLARKDAAGLAIQGPPGTGKTHTIANIIAHYMATGQRVLVSARSAEALAAVQGRLPDSIRDLAISVIHSDNEGARRLERAVGLLASQVKEVDSRSYNERRIELEAELSETRRHLADADRAIKDYAELNLRAVPYQGETLMPMELSARVQAERSAHTWFRDKIDLSPRFDALFDNGDVAEARRIRQSLGADLAYALDELPDAAALPDAARLLAAHRALAEDGRAASKAAAGELPLASVARADVGRVRALRAWLDEATNWRGSMSAEDAWLAEAYALLAGAKPAHASLRDTLKSLFLEWVDLADQGRPHLLRGVRAPDAGPAEEALDAAIASLAGGKRAFGLFSFGATSARLKACLAEIRVDGGAPAEPDAWRCIGAYREWQRRARNFLGRWSTVAATAGLPHTFGDFAAATLSLFRYGEPIGRMLELHRAADGHLEAMAVLFPYGVEPKRVILHLETSPVREALAAALDREGHAEAHALRRQLADLAQAGKRPFHLALADVVQALGEPGANPGELAEAWHRLSDEAARLDGLRPLRQRLEVIAEKIRASGAPLWSAAMLEPPPVGDADPWTPDTWAASWEWARACGHVRLLSDRRALEAMTTRRSGLEQRQQKLLVDLVRVRTFLGLKQSITEQVASALARFVLRVRQLGRGTGKAAERHRRAIREATLEAAVAVPCWILPEWRVAEQLPSVLGAFDLVIIDEASQSDVTALPVIMRGKKLLVVGDDKQVSPSNVGMEDRTVIQLRETFLRGMGAASYLEPTTSLYDMASVTFPGDVVMLREHFRCVEPIIAFSSRFYPKALIPLRVPTAAERLDPPLIDVYLPHGRKARDVNEAEAGFIVNEIKQLLELPEYASRTFGVISLIGDKQAKLIQSRLVAAVGTDAIAHHRIMCGNASTFQGQERDVMFLSMVACPRTARAQTTPQIEQRINVAMSRARDRMYLVRSVAASMLRPSDLKLAVINHFRDPITKAAALDQAVLEETESPFEREVGGMLLDRGYRIRPQVRVGTFRIDFVVEGEGDRRLAVELDGDRFHGPDRWHEDIMRQRALERVGWTFWRCWGSHWLANRQECFDDLLARLEGMGIAPVGGEIGEQVYTQYRVIEPDQGAERVSEQEKQQGPETATDQAPDQGLGEAAQSAAAESGHPVLATVNRNPVTPAADNAAPGVAATTGGNEDGNEVVEAGDTVIVRFADTNLLRRFRLTHGANDPEAGEINVAQPVAVALLGNGVEDEVELLVDGRSRRVVIEKIAKAA